MVTVWNERFPKGGYAWLDENKKVLEEQLPEIPFASEINYGLVILTESSQVNNASNNSSVMTPQRTKESISQEFTNILSNQAWINDLKVILGI